MEDGRRVMESHEEPQRGPGRARSRRAGGLWITFLSAVQLMQLLLVKQAEREEERKKRRRQKSTGWGEEQQGRR